jgi:DNA-binding transcriptional ArsR family regulator
MVVPPSTGSPGADPSSVTVLVDASPQPSDPAAVAPDAPPPSGTTGAQRVAVPARETIRHPPKDALDLSQILRTVGDPLRLSMVRMLADGREMLCGPLGEALGLPKSTGSYHLRLLREAGVTRTRQDGTLRYVSLRRDDLDERFPGLVDVLTGAE